MSENEVRETFTIGDKVVWKMNKMDSYSNERHLKEYGDGPFEVTNTKNVPINVCLLCNQPVSECYCTADDNMGIPPQTMRESAGHHQHVCIADNDGPIMDYTGKKNHQVFSGYWFKKV